MSVLKLIHKPLSDDDLRHILGEDIKIIKYSQLADYNDLNDLLPQRNDCCILFYEEQLDVGHWTGLLKYDDKFEHFDSYGIKPDSELRWLTMRARQRLNEAIPYLSNLLAKVAYIYNTVRFQSDDHTVNTCGSHVAFRLYNFKKNSMHLKQYQDYMKELKTESQMSYDFIVSEWVRKMI